MENWSTETLVEPAEDACSAENNSSVVTLFTDGILLSARTEGMLGCRAVNLKMAMRNPILSLRLARTRGRKTGFSRPGSFSAAPSGPARCVGLGRLGMRCSYLRRGGFASAHFPKIGISCFANMAEFDFPVLEIRDDNQVSAHCGNDGSKLIDMDVSVPSFEL
jgi:hypothetical protein